jgi:hypothetical protein
MSSKTVEIHRPRSKFIDLTCMLISTMGFEFNKIKSHATAVFCNFYADMQKITALGDVRQSLITSHHEAIIN